MDKKNIAIVTHIGRFNNGNRLQNYALQTYIEKNFNFNVKTIEFYPYSNEVHEKLSLSHRIIDYLRKKNKIKEKIKLNNFKKFDKFIYYDSKKYNEDEIQILNDKYDFFVSGSDQVWNSEMSKTFRNYFLDGIDNSKKVSYAASVAKIIMNEYDKVIFNKYLDKFKGISVREYETIDILKPFTSKNVECNVDPTLLLSREDWGKIEHRPNGLKKDFLFVCILGNQLGEYSQKIDAISKKYNLQVVSITDIKNKFYSIGPREFVYLIHNARAIIADSFHACVFSIIFNKPLIYSERKSLFTNMSGRIKNLEILFNVKFKTIEEIDISSDQDIFSSYFKDVEKVLKIENQRSYDYLKRVFNESRINNNLNDKDFNCSGCGLCASICPKKAINYIENDSGFIEPVIDEKKCIHCGLCSNICTNINTMKKEVFDKNIFALKRKEDIYDKSSSAGVFRTLAEYILSNNGVIFGAAYNKDDNSFVMIEKIEDLYKIQGSKYYQFNITKSYPEIENELNKNKLVLVCATPCQITGLHEKFKNYKNLYLVQVVCHGVSSFKLFKKYCLEKFKCMPEQINFRCKKPSWDNFSVEYTLKKDKIILEERSVGWMKLFLSNIALNQSCYRCNYAGKETGADLIVGDCWGINQINKDFYSNNGVSILAVNTEKGKELYSKISSLFEIYKIPNNKFKFCNINIFKNIEFGEIKEKSFVFYNNLQGKNLSEILSEDKQAVIETTKRTFLQKVKDKIKKIIRY